MGKCYSSCLPKSNGEKTLSLNILSAQSRSVDFTFLVDDSAVNCGPKKRSFLSRLFKKRTKHDKKPVLELVDNFLNPHTSNYSRLNESQRLPSTGSCTSRDIQLQYLDARALLARTNASTPTNSLDLEWEHETLPISMSHDPSGSSWTAIPEDTLQSSPQNTATGQNSDSDWSRVSSAENSLEWDNVENSMQASPPMSEIDNDTQFLLSEIERLTNQTLRETGQDLFS